MRVVESSRMEGGRAESAESTTRGKWSVSMDGGGWSQKRAVLSPPLLRRTPADPLESRTPGTLHVGKRRAELGNYCGTGTSSGEVSGQERQLRA